VIINVYSFLYFKAKSEFSNYRAMVPANSLKTTRQLASYPGMKRLPINIFSAACVICGIASISIQVGNRQRQKDFDLCLYARTQFAELIELSNISFNSKFTFKTATLAIFLETFERYYVYFPSDVVSHGIWGGLLYLTAGSLGLAVAYMRKKTL
jgi:hypothetical protein